MSRKLENMRFSVILTVSDDIFTELCTPHPLPPPQGGKYLIGNALLAQDLRPGLIYVAPSELGVCTIYRVVLLR